MEQKPKRFSPSATYGDRYDRQGNEKYFDELSENSINKDIIYACERSFEDVETQDDEQTLEIIKHEKLFNHLSIA